MNNIGLVYEQKSEYQTALEYLQQALTIFQQIGIKQKQGVPLIV